MNKLVNISFVLLILATFVGSGYYSKQDINDMAYVVAIGIDTGTNNDLQVSFQFSIPSKNSSEGGSSPDTVIDTIESSSIESAISLANGYISKKVNLSHCKVLVISEEIAVNRYF